MALKDKTLGEVAKFFLNYGAFIVSAAVFLYTIGIGWAAGLIEETVDERFNKVETKQATQTTAITNLTTTTESLEDTIILQSEQIDGLSEDLKLILQKLEAQ